MSGCMTVTGPPRSICGMKVGTTEPRLPMTLPKRTAANLAARCPAPNARTSSSAMRLVAPMMLVGRTALSVEMRTNVPVS